MAVIAPHVSLFDLVMCITEMIDLADPMVADHHKRVAYLAASLATELGFSPDERAELLLAGILHDVGMLSPQERDAALQFELREAPQHPEDGARLLEGFPPLARVAPLVRHHHVPWEHGRGAAVNGVPVPAGSHLLHLADRVAILLRPQQEVLGQAPAIVDAIAGHAGTLFVPAHVEAFKTAAVKEYLWLDVVSPAIGSVLRRLAPLQTLELESDALIELARMFRQIIDFRSPFTATHSSGVAAGAHALAARVGFSDRECRIMHVAGSLHDLGKLAIPTTILQKPAPLTPAEFAVIRSHTFHGYRCLERLPALETVNRWGSLHHERLDGHGYPFHLAGDEISLGSRIMAVADAFTALTEDRPYRAGLPQDAVLRVLRRQVSGGALDASLVDLLARQYAEIDERCRLAQAASQEEYRQFRLPPAERP